MYASDSFLNRHHNLTTDNIYDIPNADLDNSLENLNDLMKHATISSKHRSSSTKANMCNQKLLTKPSTSVLPLLSRVSDIYDYDIYYGKRNAALLDNTCQRRKTPLLCSPLHYHPGSNLSTSNRPNSRNSLNSRLSSSHNSLTVPTTNKADDSIFITQAMSHDALTGREISDFYNVPIDSDIYALPIDVIKPEIIDINVNANKSIIGGGYKNLRGKLKYVRNNKKRRKLTNDCASAGTSSKTLNKTMASDKRHSVPENIEPMHMTLDEVKRFYHSLYSSSSDSNDVVGKKWISHGKRGSCGTSSSVIGTINNNNNNIAIGKNDKNSVTHSVSGVNNIFKPTIIVNNKTLTVNLKNKKHQSTKEECSNNNNTISSQKYETTTMTNSQQSTTTTASTKKQQFSISMNLKQKFCSIFRFRKSSTHQNSNSTNTLTNLNSEYSETNRTQNDLKTTNNDGNGKKDKKVKFSTRALPPLPAKGKHNISLLL